MQPKRLLDAHGEPSDVTRLLRAAQRDAAPTELRRATWKALAAQTALTGIALGSTLPAAAKGASAVAASTSSVGSSLGAGTLVSKAATLATMKSLVLGVSIGGGIVATYSAATHFTEPATEQWTVPSVGSPAAAKRKAMLPPKPAASVAHAPPLETPIEAPTPSATTNALSVSNSQNTLVARQSSAVDALRIEARRVSEARTLVRSGKGAEALKKLAEIDATSPAGVLRQERDALRIDALFLTGQKLEAQKLVRQFSMRYPESPLVARWAARVQ